MNQNSIQIQLQDDLPDTHYFIYKTKKYPFKFEFFKISSKYFSSHQEELEQKKIIPLLGTEREDYTNISDDSINTFIQYVHREKVSLNNENSCSLNYLATKYEVLPLISVTKKYISDHQNELVLTILSIHQNDSNFETNIYEEMISEHLVEYIDDERLLDLKIPILYRILNEFNLKQSTQKVQMALNDKIFNFLFKCLDKYGIEASVLFEFVDFESGRSENLNKLLTKYSNKFDFHFINKKFLQNVYDTQSKILEDQIKYNMNQERKEDEIKNIKNEILNLKEDQKQKEKQISSLNTEISQLKEDQKQKEKQIGSLNTEVSQLKEDKKQKEKQIGSLNTEIAHLKEENGRLKINQTRQIEEQRKKVETDINRIKTECFDKISKQCQLLTADVTNVKKEIQEIEKQKISPLALDMKQMKDDHKVEIDSIKDRFKEQNQSIFQNNYGKLKSGINEIKSTLNSNLFSKADGLLLYLSQEAIKSTENPNKNDDFIFIQQNEANGIIGIGYKMTEILYNNRCFETNEFEKEITNLSELIIEIQYPSSYYDDLYQKVLKIKKLHPSVVKIKIFITQISSTDQKFHQNKDIDYVKLDSCVTKIESSNKDGSFEECSSLIGISIPSSVTEIKDSSFWNCTSLKQISLPSSLALIDVNSFGYCESITQITIPSSVNRINGGAFKFCASLAQITIPSSVTSLGDNAFEGCTSLTQISIPSSVTSIGKNAFEGCTSLKQISIPSSVTSIVSDAFKGCSSLTQISLPSSFKYSNIGLDSKVKVTYI